MLFHEFQSKLRHMQYKPEFVPEEVRKDAEESEIDPYSLPFFCESFLYPLMGKEDARTILALIRPLAHLNYAMSPKMVDAISRRVDLRGISKTDRDALASKIKEWLDETEG